jgi:hypothetical protein
MGVSLDSLNGRLKGLEERIGRMEREYEKIRKRKEGWRIFGREKGRVVFKSDTGELAKIPEELLPIILHLKPFDGRIDDDGDYVVYVREGAEVCKAPKSLIDRLIEKGGEGVGV